MFSGVDVYQSSDNLVEGNYVGTDITGTVGLGNGQEGILIQDAASNTIGGTTAGAGNVLSGNRSYGLYLVDTGTSGNVVAGNLVGTAVTGSAALGNAINGVYLAAGAASNTIGGTTASARNIISASGDYGVEVDSSNDNLLEGNYVGTDGTGTQSVPNSTGILVVDSSVGNTIGGLTSVPGTGAGNVISGNTNDGVEITGSDTTGNLVAGNLVGTSAAGTAALGNGTGILIASTPENTIGGAAAGAGNVISGNADFGVEISGSGTTGTLVAGNIIGTTADGTAALGNGANGVEIDTGASNNTIGGLTTTPGTGAGNLMSGNAGNGVDVVGGGGNLIEGNLIGTNLAGSSALTNAAGGIRLDESSSDTIGGTAAGARNVISGNAQSVMTDAYNLFLHGASDETVQGNYIGTDVTGNFAVSTSTQIGIYMSGSGNLIGGTASSAGNVISGNSGYGVAAEGSGNVFEGNLIGTDAAGQAAIANGNGILINGVSGNTIGGTAEGAGNVISGNTTHGLYFIGAGAIDNFVEGNLIGTNSDGTAAVPNGSGVIFEAGSTGNTIGGLTATPGTGTGNVISGNTGQGVYVLDSGGNLIEGNLIGTDLAGSTALANGIEGIVLDGSNNDTIGGIVNGARNVISGNGTYNVYVFDASDETIEGNDVGTDVTGSFALTTITEIGIQVAGSSSDNLIGGTAPGAGNVIAGNSEFGVNLYGVDTTDNLVQGNLIGTDFAGTAAIPNGTGVLVQAGSTGNTIGGTASGAGNVISGNTRDGIEITAAGTSGNVVAGNLLGTNAGGTAALGNGLSGVEIDSSASSNTVGGSAFAARNVISGNGNGIFVESSTDDVIEGNLIGTNVAGSAAVPNGLYGVFVDSGSTGTTIGGTAAGAGNVISGNAINGVEITGSGTSGNLVAGNFIGTNSTGDSAIANGANGVEIDTGASGNTIGGLTTTPGAGAGNVISGNALGIDDFGGGNDLIVGNIVGANAAGTAAIANTSGGIAVNTSGDTIGGTAVGARNVISGNDEYNVDLYGGGNDTVQGNDVGTDVTGSFAVSTITEVGIGIASGSDDLIGGTAPGAGNVIAGNTEFGVNLYSADTTDNLVQGNLIGTNVAGTAAIPNGAGVLVQAGSTGNTIGGTASGAGNVISGNTRNGVEITAAGTSGNLVAGNFLGTTAAGTAALGNGFNGVEIDSDASSNTIGGTAATARNVISGNPGNGVLVENSTDDVIQGNLIGTGVAGSAAVPNGEYGVFIRLGATGITVGGTAAGAGNVISGNGLEGVEINGSGTTGNIVAGNWIGTNRNGTAALGNTTDGVQLSAGASANTIGGTTPARAISFLATATASRSTMRPPTSFRAT